LYRKTVNIETSGPTVSQQASSLYYHTKTSQLDHRASGLAASQGRGAGGSTTGTLAQGRAPQNGSSLSQVVRSTEGQSSVDRGYQDLARQPELDGESSKARCLLFIQSLAEGSKTQPQSAEGGGIA